MSITDCLYQYAGSVIFHDESDLQSYNGYLYHYTNNEGLLGILTSQRIWGTEASYLNDSNEIEYGLCLAKKTLEEEAISSNSSLIQHIAKLAIEYLSEKSEETYVACFSEDGDLLSQWKGYANFGNGYAVEFEASELARFKRKHPNWKICIKRVIYDIAQQKNSILVEINKILIECSNLLSEFSEQKENILNDGAHALASVLKHKALFFKNEVFKEEREWRAIYLNFKGAEEGRMQVKFRCSSDSIIPYLPLDIGPSAGKKIWSLPISTIIVGSKVNKKKIEKSIELIYKNQNLIMPTLKYSQIPLQ